MESGLLLPPWLGWLLLALGVCLVLYLLTRFLTWKPRTKAKARRAATILEVTEGQAEDWDQALELARESLQKGDLRQSLWLGHRLTLHRLDQAESLVFERSKTNQTYLRECRAGKHLELLSELTKLYDEVIYAHRPAIQTRVAELLAEVESL